MDSSPVSTTINLVHSMINTVCASIFIRSNNFYFYISLILTFIELKINFSSLIIHIIRLWDIFAGFFEWFKSYDILKFLSQFSISLLQKVLSQNVMWKLHWEILKLAVYEFSQRKNHRSRSILLQNLSILIHSLKAGIGVLHICQVWLILIDHLVIISTVIIRWITNFFHSFTVMM